MELTARMNSSPMLRSVSCIQVVWPKTWISEPKGITEMEINDMVTARKGASR